MGGLMQGKFVPKNPKKYIGTNISAITYRSSWELTFMSVCDNHPSIVQWASECIWIAYKHPLSGKWTKYKPDFFIVYIDAGNKQHAEMVEIKPEKEMPGYPGKVNKNTKLVQAVNAAKWAAAIAFCKQRGWKFTVANEKNLFAFKPR